MVQNSPCLVETHCRSVVSEGMEEGQRGAEWAPSAGHPGGHKASVIPPGEAYGLGSSCDQAAAGSHHTLLSRRGCSEPPAREALPRKACASASLPPRLQRVHESRTPPAVFSDQPPGPGDLLWLTTGVPGTGAPHALCPLGRPEPSHGTTIVSTGLCCEPPVRLLLAKARTGAVHLCGTVPGTQPVPRGAE